MELRLLFAGLFVTVLADLRPFQISELQNLPNSTLSFLLMGDPQFHFVCELPNVQCVDKAMECLKKYNFPKDLRLPDNITEEQKRGKVECMTIMGNFSNRIQRKAVGALLDSMNNKPRAMIIDGDLTNDAENYQFKQFTNTWIRDFPIPIWPGLGNHDYQNAVNRTERNPGINQTLNWFINALDDLNVSAIDVDVEESADGLTVYKGSLAYVHRGCSEDGSCCANIIQLNNHIEYTNTIRSGSVIWNISPSVDFFKTELYKLNEDEVRKFPVIVNMHNGEMTRKEPFISILKDWVKFQRQKDINPKIIMFFAHHHQSHEVMTYCIDGVSVPFAYVGSVPKNRFSILSLSSEKSILYGFHVLEDGIGGRAFPAGATENLWKPCSKNQKAEFVPVIDAFQTDNMDSFRPSRYL